MVLSLLNEQHFEEAGWTCEQDENSINNSLQLSFHENKHSKTMPHNSSLTFKEESLKNQSKIMNRIEKNETIANGRRQSKRKELLDALRNFTKEQSQPLSDNHNHHHHIVPNSAPANIIGFHQSSRPSTSSSTRTTTTMHRVQSQGTGKDQIRSSSRQRPRTGTQSKQINEVANNHHNRTKSLFMQSAANFLRGSSDKQSKDQKVGSNIDSSSIPSDYSDPDLLLNHRSKSVNTTKSFTNLINNESVDFDIRSALTYSTNGQPPQDHLQINQVSNYIPTNTRRSFKMVFEEGNIENLPSNSFPTESSFPLEMDKRYLLPTGWTTEQLERERKSGEGIDPLRNFYGLKDDGMDNELIERLANDILLPSNMSSEGGHHNSSSSSSSNRRLSTAARRYASLYRNNQSEENLSTSSLMMMRSKQHQPDPMANESKLIQSLITPNEFRRKSAAAAADYFSLKSTQDHNSPQEPIKTTPLPPRRMTRRARVQSTCEIEKRNVIEKEFLKEEKRPSMPIRQTTFPINQVERIRVPRRRTSESSLSSARNSTNNSLTIMKKSNSSSDNQSMQEEYKRNDGSIERLRKSFRSEESLLMISNSKTIFINDEKQQQLNNDSSRFSISSSSSFQSNTTGTNGTSIDGDESESSFENMAKGPIIVQPTTNQLIFPHENLIVEEKNLSSLSPTSFASANSELWGSCYSNISSDNLTSTNFKQSNHLRRRPSTANGFDCNSNVPPVPSVPAKYASNTVKMTNTSPRFHRFASENHASLEKHIHHQNVLGITQDDSMLNSSSSSSSAAMMMKRTNTTPTMTVQYGSDEHEEEGSICLETPTFGYVASFVTATNLTPRPNNLSSFNRSSPIHSQTFQNYSISPSLIQNSLNGPLNSHFTKPQFQKPLKGIQGGDLIKSNDVFDPRSMRYIEPISPKTKFENDDFDDEKKSKDDSITLWQKTISSQQQQQQKKDLNEFPTYFGLGLSHVKLALAERTHCLSKVDQNHLNQSSSSQTTTTNEIHKVPSRTFGQRLSVSQSGAAAIAAIQNRRNSLRLNTTKSRN